MFGHTNLSVFYHTIVAMKMSPNITWSWQEIEAMSPLERDIALKIYSTISKEIQNKQNSGNGPSFLGRK